jgi:hypothetical protein
LKACSVFISDSINYEVVGVLIEFKIPAINLTYFILFFCSGWYSITFAKRVENVFKKSPSG